MPFIGNKPSAVPLTSADIADGIITSAKIVDATITNSDVASSIITGQTAETSIAGGDSILIYDDSATALRKMTRTNFVSGLGGVALAEEWRTNANQTANATTSTVLTNWELTDSDGGSTIGAGITHSSGVFTFPSTGVYLIIFNCFIARDGNSRYNDIQISTTTNNSTYDAASVVGTSLTQTSGDESYASSSNFFTFGVTSTTTHKVRFEIYPEQQVTVYGNTSLHRTSATFIKLGNI
jgi:hypothetical protein